MRREDTYNKMERKCKANKIILAYLEQYEDIMADGKGGLEIAEKIYSELINDDYLPVDLKIAEDVADILLIDYEYEFSEEKILISVSNDITFHFPIGCRASN